MKTVGDRLREVRSERGLSQEQLEKLSGVRQAVISKIERGATLEPGFQLMAKLAQAMGVEFEALLPEPADSDPNTIPFGSPTHAAFIGASSNDADLQDNGSAEASLLNAHSALAEAVMAIIPERSDLLSAAPEIAAQMRRLRDGLTAWLTADGVSEHPKLKPYFDAIRHLQSDVSVNDTLINDVLRRLELDPEQQRAAAQFAMRAAPRRMEAVDLAGLLDRMAIFEAQARALNEQMKRLEKWIETDEIARQGVADQR